MVSFSANTDATGYVMRELFRDMLAVTTGVIIGGLVLMAVYDYFHGVYLPAGGVGG